MAGTRRLYPERHRRRTLQLAISHDKAAALYQPSVSIEGNNALLVELSGILQQ